MIKKYFLDFHTINSDISIDLSSGATTIHNNGKQRNWKVHLVDTGLNTQTGGRLRRLKDWLEGEETFMFTYGDGVADIDIWALGGCHKSHGKIAPVTMVRPPERFGRIVFEENQVVEFYEKPQSGEGWINGGFFVLNHSAIDYVGGDNTIWERQCVEKLAHDEPLIGYRHFGFWSCMDTVKEKKLSRRTLERRESALESLVEL